jgi:hypothetical protein
MACTVAQHHRALTATVHHSLTTRRKAGPENTGKLGNQQITPAQKPEIKIDRSPPHQLQLISGSRLSA